MCEQLVGEEVTQADGGKHHCFSAQSTSAASGCCITPFSVAFVGVRVLLGRGTHAAVCDDASQRPLWTAR